MDAAGGQVISDDIPATSDFLRASSGSWLPEAFQQFPLLFEMRDLDLISLTGLVGKTEATHSNSSIKDFIWKTEVYAAAGKNKVGKELGGCKGTKHWSRCFSSTPRKSLQTAIPLRGRRRPLPPAAASQAKGRLILPLQKNGFFSQPYKSH